MTRDEYAFASVLAEEEIITLPPFHKLKRGGIVGQAVVTDCVPELESPWFFGEFGFVLADAKPLPFQPCKGALGFFRPCLE